MLPELPLGLSTFRTLRNEGFLYVDKTKQAYDIVRKGARRFLFARPRRFGKSLFVSTLKEILEGNRDLFTSLWISQSDYSWDVHGVIDLDISRWGIRSAEEWKVRLSYALREIAGRYGLELSVDVVDPVIMLSQLVNRLYARFGRVALLIDEYDSAVLQALHDEEEAKKIIREMRSLFGAVKGLDAYLSVVFITGIVSFSQAGVFSGMNNLEVISFNKQYAGICGYTDEEIDLYFKDFLEAWSQEQSISYAVLRDKIRTLYNGYCFNQYLMPVLYNPFSIIYAMKTRSLQNFWIQSGASTFLIEEIVKEYRRSELQIFDPVVDPEQFITSQELLSCFDIGKTPLRILMFQAGYLTIKGYDSSSDVLRLGYPNQEVQRAFQAYVVSVVTHYGSSEIITLASQLAPALNNRNVEKFL